MTVLNSDEATAYSGQFKRGGIRLGYEHVQFFAPLVDFMLIVAASVFSGITYHLVLFSIAGDIMQYIAAGFLVALIFSLTIKIISSYSIQDLMDVGKQIRTITWTWTLAFFILTSLAFSLKIVGIVSRGYVGLFFITGIASLVASRLLWREFLRYALDRGLFVQRRILAICEDDSGPSWACITDLQRYGHTPVSTVTLAPTDSDPERIQAVIKQVAAITRNLHIDEIVVSISLDRLTLVGQVITGLRSLPLPVRLAVDAASASLVLRPSQLLGGTVSFQVQRHPLRLLERVLKRSLDITVAATALVILAPTMLITAMAIKIESPGPVLFKQLRYGLNGKRFRILKFRSMTVMEDGKDFQQARRGDKRVTWVGKIIRKTSIDELPQLWNVLRGDMSIVGPRPHAVAHDDAYEELIQRYAMRRFMKPGMTGWAQVNGSRGETTLESMKKRVEYDLSYIDNWSLKLDIVVILRTFVMLFNSKDVY